MDNKENANATDASNIGALQVETAAGTPEGIVRKFTNCKSYWLLVLAPLVLAIIVILPFVVEEASFRVLTVVLGALFIYATGHVLFL